MQNTILTILVLMTLISCTQNEKQKASISNNQRTFESIRVDRFAVKNGNPDSISLSSYIVRTFNKEGNEIKSVYHSTDNSIMMQFVNKYEEGNKTRVNWVNADKELVKYIKNTFNEDNKLAKSESFSPQGEFQSGFIHNWKEGGKIEEKGPLEEGKPFKPNAIYKYNDKDEFELLKEYNEKDSLYAVVKWNYTKNDDFGNWIERQMITNDTINQIEKRSIQYRNEVTTYLENVVKDYNIPSISAGILVDGKIIWSGAAGLSNREQQVEASSETLYRIGSISKVLTATLVFKLVELGKLDLQYSIQKYLPDYPIDRKGHIKVIHLLSHTSGIDHYKGKETRSFIHYDNLRDASRLFETRKLKFEPGTKYRYTSYGFTLLGAVIEAATGKSYEANLKELILDKAGMQNTHIEDRYEMKLNQAKLYKKKGDDIILDVDNDLSNIYPAGGLVSTATDLLLFFDAWKNGKLISFENVQKMVDVIEFNGQILDENAGLGWNIWKDNKHGWVCHRIGGQSGTSALLISYREKGVTVALLSNQAVLDPIWEITNTLIGYGLDQKK